MTGKGQRRTNLSEGLHDSDCSDMAFDAALRTSNHSISGTRHGLDPRGSRSLTCQLFGVHCGLRRLGRTYEGDVAVRHKIASMQELLMACVEEGIHHRCRRRRTTPVWSASPLESHAPRQLARSNSQNDAQRAFNGDESGHHQTGGRCDFIRGRALEAILD